MCGIIGAHDSRIDITPRLLDGLEALEYRGYDSAGVAVVGENGLEVRRAVGEVARLRSALKKAPLSGYTGIGHTRWATHGTVEARNAHPHRVGRVAVVHNGIVENHRHLRQRLEAQGRVFRSDTDSEILAHLIDAEYGRGGRLIDVVRRALRPVEGSYAVAVVFEDAPGRMVAARYQSPLSVAHDAGRFAVASDAFAVAQPFTKVMHLEDGDVAELSPSGITIEDVVGSLVTREPVVLRRTNSVAPPARGDAHEHHMRREIMEQPAVLRRAVDAHFDLDRGLPRDMSLGSVVAFARHVDIVACGSSHYAGQVFRDWLERHSTVRVGLDVASEWRYRAPRLGSGDVVIVISQSGETADTLAAMRHAKAAGARTIAVVNVAQSTMAREADYRVLTHAGREIGVASTKAYVAQLVALGAIALGAASATGSLTPKELKQAVASFGRLSAAAQRALAMDAPMREIGRRLHSDRPVMFIGRGALHPVALEGALKLKEISYIPAEGFAAGELKHGPLALVAPDTEVFALAPYDELFAKTLSNVAEVEARGGRVRLLTDGAGHDTHGARGVTQAMPLADAWAAPILYAIPLQLLAYHAAHALGRNIDRPRNLAKSVTVE